MSPSITELMGVCTEACPSYWMLAGKETASPRIGREKYDILCRRVTLLPNDLSGLRHFGLIQGPWREFRPSTRPRSHTCYPCRSSFSTFVFGRPFESDG